MGWPRLVRAARPRPRSRTLGGWGVAGGVAASLSLRSERGEVDGACLVVYLGSIFNGGGFGQARTGTGGISGFGNGRSCEERVEPKGKLCHCWVVVGSGRDPENAAASCHAIGSWEFLGAVVSLRMLLF